MAPRGRAVLLFLVALAPALLACGYSDYDQRGGQAIADQIRSAAGPIVQEVSYSAGDSIDPASVDIFVRPGTPASEVSALMCGVVIPTIRAGDPPDDFGTTILDHLGTSVLATESHSCPSS
jgi:hypothetical protein